MSFVGFFILLIPVQIVLSADPTVYLKQTFPYTTKVDGYPTLVVEKDKDAYLACVVDKKPKGMPVQWMVQNYKTNTTIPISTDTDTKNSFKYQLDKPATNNWRLKIQNVQPSDEALYICRVQLHGRFQMDNISRMVKVIQKPQIIDIYTTSDTTREEGQRMEFKCAASGIPKPLIKWELAGGGILPTGGREYVAPSLSIDSVNRNHKGHYKCVAENIAGRDVRRIALNVEFAPKLVAKEPDVYQAVGYSREIKCEVSGNPPPTAKQIMWNKDGVPLDNKDKYTFETYFGSNYVLMKLIIHDIDSSDYGRYRCYAENSEGNGENFVTLSESEDFVSDRPSSTGSSSFLAFSITTIVMLLSTFILHFC
ncbi:protein amalgam-like [Mercenaria mercenaria]|uniref:protein amalgam-like n=1 Tax=Mercenaria mercenaria TaxID=6596 RepID=UPI00234E8B24|nr:protein amalgam-like [Mercenaria mercenaria]